ncbi:MAG: prolipoprotein diacylglyceryl transferase [Gammaproteobacteria bacterium]|nr:prolipoprotein diacylglyceryl transferase [Gammaproteobacteria bacterium]
MAFMQPAIDPVIFEIGPLALRWYGVMYLVGFFGASWLAGRSAERFGFTREQVSDMIFYGFLGAILGGRIGYVFFYQFGTFISDPLYLLRAWEGGMSFHGGLLGVIAVMLIFARRYQRSFWQIADFTAPLIPIGLGAGRLGNFINGELWGRVTDLPWGVIFTSPKAGPLPRHPSQLYEFFLEGVVLFFALQWFSKRSRGSGQVAGLFLLLYGLFRIAVEFVRERDAHLHEGYLWGLLSMGQLLSLPMIALGLYLLLRPAPLAATKE